MKKLNYYNEDLVVWVDLSSAIGEEFGGIRPAKILDRRGSLIQIMPYYLKNDKYFPDRFQLRTIDVSRIIGLYQRKDEIDEIKQAIC